MLQSCTCCWTVKMSPSNANNAGQIPQCSSRASEHHSMMHLRTAALRRIQIDDDRICCHTAIRGASRWGWPIARPYHQAILMIKSGCYMPWPHNLGLHGRMRAQAQVLDHALHHAVAPPHNQGGSTGCNNLASLCRRMHEDPCACNVALKGRAISVERSNGRHSWQTRNHKVTTLSVLEGTDSVGPEIKARRTYRGLDVGLKVRAVSVQESSLGHEWHRVGLLGCVDQGLQARFH